MMPPWRTPYELAPPLTESATMVSLPSALSNSTSWRFRMSFTKSPPFGSCRTAAAKLEDGFGRGVGRRNEADRGGLLRREGGWQNGQGEE